MRQTRFPQRIVIKDANDIRGFVISFREWIDRARYFYKPAAVQVASELVQQAQCPGVTIGGRCLDCPIAKGIDDPGNDHEVSQTVKEPGTQPEPMMQAFPQCEPQIASLILEVNVEFSMDRQRARFE